MIEIYENQRYYHISQTWGTALDANFRPLFDRYPLTDETGTKIMDCTLAEVQCINGYAWMGNWESTVFEYAIEWNYFKPGVLGSVTPKLGSYVRRRLWRRTMIVDPNSITMKQYSPYVLFLKIRRATFISSQGVL